MSMDLCLEVHTSSYTWHHKCYTFLSMPTLLQPPFTSQSMLLSSSYLTVQPVSNRNTGFAALLPWMIAHSDKEAGQANIFSCQGLVQQPKRWRRGMYSDWWLGHWPGKWEKGSIGAVHKSSSLAESSFLPFPTAMRRSICFSIRSILTCHAVWAWQTVVNFTYGWKISFRVSVIGFLWQIRDMINHGL